MVHNILKCFFLSAFLLFAQGVLGQKISNINPVRDGNKIKVYYTLSGVKYYQSCHVSLFVSMDGGKSFTGPLLAVSGDVGDHITKGEKMIVWDVFKDMAKLEGPVVFEVRAKVSGDNRKRSVFAAYSGSYYSPIGIQFGQIGKVSWYIAARANHKFTVKTKYEATQTGVTGYTGDGYYIFDDESFRANYAVSGGLNFQCSRNVFIYLGAGYGNYTNVWHIDEYRYPDDVSTGDAYVKDTKNSGSGPEVEAGFHIKIKKLVLTVGGADVAFKKETAEAAFGLGYCFN